jgi:MFS transporter, UMF1 family
MVDSVQVEGRRTFLPQAAAGIGSAGLFSWLIYEWAAQPFYSLITTFLFAPFFANAFVGDPVAGQSYWGYAAAAAGLAVAILSPLLGAFADASGNRKGWIVVSLIIFMAGMASLWLADPGQPDRLIWILLAYIVASIAAEVSATFVNAMMPGLVAPQHYGRLSGTSAALGYLGGLLALTIVAGLLVGDAGSGKTLFGFTPLLSLDAISRQGDRLVGPFCALWLFVFALPMLLFTPDRQVAKTQGGFDALKQTFGELKHHKDIILFLVSRMLFTDGLLAMFAFGGIYGTALFGWSTTELGMFGIILIVAAMIGAAIGGYFDDRVGPKAVIIGSLMIAFIAAAGVVSVDKSHVLFGQAVTEKVPGSGFLASTAERWFLGFTIFVGLVTGPLGASSRSLMARLAPKDRITQFFGLFAFSGKASSFIAPLLVGGLTAATGEQRWGLAVVLVFLAAGLIMMPMVRASRDPDGEAFMGAQGRGANRSVGAAMVDPEEYRGSRVHPERDGADIGNLIGRVIVAVLFLASLAVIIFSLAFGR